MNFEPTIPIFRSFDEAKAKAFYVDFLGFTVDWEHRFGPDAPLYMQVSRDRCVLHLSEHHGDCCPGGAVRIRSEQLEDFQQQLLAAKASFARPAIQDQTWGMREMMLTDPFGNRLVFYVEIPK
ncbi:MAG: VOC family protein [Rhodocyclaceae bacterium]|nr:VOC family protein [Rhodocyclaceae bacterium]